MRQGIRVLVTGGTGFVGNVICRRLWDRRYKICAPIRNKRHATGGLIRPNIELWQTGDLSNFRSWERVVQGNEVVIHLVARTHVTDEHGDVLGTYRAVNVEITRRLAQAAVREGVRHFIYMSSIKAVGNGCQQPYDEANECDPEDSYGITKLEAERELVSLLHDTSCRLTILRPPLVYGPGVRGNFLRLLRLVNKGIPFPAISNARSMVHVENLADSVLTCIDSAAAFDEIFHVADETPMSTSDLIRAMSEGMQRSPRLVPVPRSMLTKLGQTFGRGEEIKRLAGSLTVSTDKIRRVLGWIPRVTTEQGVRQTSLAFLNHPWTEDGYSESTRKAA